MNIYIPLLFYPYESCADPQVAFTSYNAALDWTEETAQTAQTAQKAKYGIWEIFEVELKEI